MIRAGGELVFCNNCGSFKLRLIDDEMLQFIAQSSKKMIRCDDCGCYFSQEFIAESFALFTSEENLMKVKEDMRRLREIYSRHSVKISQEDIEDLRKTGRDVVGKKKGRRKKRQKDKGKAVQIKLGTLLEKG